MLINRQTNSLKPLNCDYKYLLKMQIKNGNSLLNLKFTDLYKTSKQRLAIFFQKENIVLIF